MKRLAMGSLMLASMPSIAYAQDTGVTAMQQSAVQVSPEGLDLPNDSKTRRKLAMFGRCLLRAYGKSDILSAIPGTRVDRQSMDGFSWWPGDCGAGDWATNAAKFMRGVYAEYNLTTDFDLRSGRQLHRPDKVFPIPSDRERAKLNEVQRVSLAFVEFGTCVAKLDPLGVSRLMTTEVGSEAENAAFSALGPALGACMKPGAAFKANTLKLRGYIAEGLYRTLSANAGGPLAAARKSL